MDIHGHVVRTLWIEHASDIATEYYASVLLDRSAKQPLVMFSVEGGVDIEAGCRARARRSSSATTSTRSRASPARRPSEIALEGGADADVVSGRGRRAHGAV